LRRPTIPIRINFLDFIFIFNLIQIIGERLRGHWGTRSFDRITFFRNSFFSFEFRSFEFFLFCTFFRIRLLSK
jgi:hypothetical protein